MRLFKSDDPSKNCCVTSCSSRRAIDFNPTVFSLTNGIFTRYVHARLAKLELIETESILIGGTMARHKSRSLSRRKQRQSLFESLEERRVLAVTWEFGFGRLNVEGDAAYDTVYLKSNSSGEVVLNTGQNDVVLQQAGAAILAAEVESINIETNDGDDLIDLRGLLASDYTNLSDGDIYIDAGEGRDRIYGSDLGEYIVTGPSPLTQYTWAFGGDDVIELSANSDSVRGGTGDDRYLIPYVPGTKRTATILEYENEGADTVDFSAIGESISVDLSGFSSYAYYHSSTNNLRLRNYISDGGVRHLENVVGTRFDDTLVGDSNDNVIEGGAGHDDLDGGSGNDTLVGGPGDDILTAGSGDDRLWGGSGNNTFHGVSGSNQYSGQNSPAEDNLPTFEFVSTPYQDLLLDNELKILSGDLMSIDVKPFDADGDYVQLAVQLLDGGVEVEDDNGAPISDSDVDPSDNDHFGWERSVREVTTYHWRAPELPSGDEKNYTLRITGTTVGGTATHDVNVTVTPIVAAPPLINLEKVL